MSASSQCCVYRTILAFPPMWHARNRAMLVRNHLPSFVVGTFANVDMEVRDGQHAG